MRQNGKSVLRASAGLYYARQNMLSQVGSVTTNGIQQKSDYRDSTFTGFADMPVWPNLLAAERASPAGTFPLFTGVRVFDRDYQNPRIYSFNAGFERELAPNVAAYVDFTVAKGVHLTRFLNYNVHGTAAAADPAGDTRHDDLRRARIRSSRSSATCSSPPASGTACTAAPRSACASGSSQYYQLEANYVLSKDEDDDSNERDPFTDRSFNFYDLSLDYGPSDRDIRHKVNFFTYAELPGECHGRTCGCRGGRRNRSRRRRGC